MRWFNKSKKMALPYPDIYKVLSQIRVDALRHLLLSISSQLLTERQGLESKINEIKKDDFDTDISYQWYIDDLSDTFHTLKDIESEAAKLSIIGLYRDLESNTISIFKWLYGKDEKKLKKLHRFDEQEKHLINDFGFDVRSLSKYKKIDELRLINNAIKHNECKVTAELKKYNRWREIIEIKNFLELFDEFCEIIPQYLKELVIQINKAVQMKNSDFKRRIND